MNYKKKAIKTKMNNSFLKNLSLNLLSKFFFMKNDSYIRVENRNMFIRKD
jgi:hypothetical protein